MKERRMLVFQKLAEGDIFATAQPDRICVGSRTAVLPDGGLICVFNAESRIGVNDFTPMASYSADGLRWSPAEPVWPELAGVKSLYVTVRPTDDGRVSLAGIGFDIAAPGEDWWSDELAAMKRDRLVYSVSDDGRAFPPPAWIDLPYPGAAEQPGGMLVDRDGAMSMVYAPYPALEGGPEADTCCLVLLRSADGGRSWRFDKIARTDPPGTYAETWLVRLSDGRRMISTWQTASAERPDQYLLAGPEGADFSGPFPMPFRGQSTSLLPGADGTVYVAYNQRRESPAGVWLAAAKPDAAGFHLLADQPVWEAAAATRSESSGDFSQWTDFSFGEPQVTALADGTLLLCLWYAEGEKKGIRFVLLRRENG